LAILRKGKREATPPTSQRKLLHICHCPNAPRQFCRQRHSLTYRPIIITEKMIDTFTAIDFETAQGKRWSICQVGLIRVEKGIIKDQVSILVQPPNNYYWDNFIDIHGITPQQTANAPTFDKVWKQIEPFIKNQNVVAHNGFSFDFHCISQTLEYYGITPPNYTGHCTYRIFRDNLASLCREHKIPLNHHNALSDAMACAKLFMIHSGIYDRAAN